MDLKEKLLHELEEGFSLYDHTFNTGLTVRQWRELSTPCCWEIVINEEHAIVLWDCAYDFVALFVDKELIDKGQGVLITEDYVVNSPPLITGQPIVLYKRI